MCLVLPMLVWVAAAQGIPPSSAMVYERANNQWFEGPSTRVTVSADGRSALFSNNGVVRLITLDTGEEDPAGLLGSLDSIRRAALCGPGKLVRFGQRGSRTGWFLPSDETTPNPQIPADATVRCSTDGRVLAYVRSSRPDELVVGPSVFDRLGGTVTAVVFSADNRTVYILVFGADGRSSLLRINRQTGARTRIANDLDAMPSYDAMALSPDERSLYIPLATSSAPRDEARQQPDASRWLKLYQVDVVSGARQLTVESAGDDNLSPAVAGGRLYWVRNVSHTAVALVSPSGAAGVREVVSAAQLPMWSPDSRRISYIVGGWRRADWALNLDAAVVNVNAHGEAVAPPTAIVQGYHEDFPPAWSPDGRWIAYHSHRSKVPVPEYESSGSADDIFLRRADDLHAPEIRLTAFGWETGSAYWSPDGRKLLFSSWVKGGEPGISKLWVLTLDVATGAVLNTTLLPLSPEIRSAQWAAWSPDGRAIAIEDNRGGDDRRLWIVDADGTHPQRLLDYRGTTYGGLDWLPTGKTIVYSGLAGRTMQLFTVSVSAGGTPQQISHDDGNLLHPRVSPNGTWIACTRSVQSQQIWQRPLLRTR
jgi:Tol biopolymer transport system component